MFHGRWAHPNIVESAHMKGEGVAGANFHYFTGATVALTYPLIFLIVGVPMPEKNLVPGLIWGMATRTGEFAKQPPGLRAFEDPKRMAAEASRARPRNRVGTVTA